MHDQHSWCRAYNLCRAVFAMETMLLSHFRSCEIIISMNYSIVLLHSILYAITSGHCALFAANVFLTSKCYCVVVPVTHLNWGISDFRLTVLQWRSFCQSSAGVLELREKETNRQKGREKKKESIFALCSCQHPDTDLDSHRSPA